VLERSPAGDDDGAGGELVLTHVHPGCTAEAARGATGWPLRVATDLAETAPPSADELAVLRALVARGAAA
jgi:glutaconate CoA-transferase subunit B